jgi:hypothetical protein
MTIHIDTVSEDGAWARAIARGCLPNGSEYVASVEEPEAGRTEAEDVIHAEGNDR